MSIWTAEEDGSEVSDRPNLSLFEGTAAFVHAAFRNATRPSVPVTRLRAPELDGHSVKFLAGAPRRRTSTIRAE